MATAHTCRYRPGHPLMVSAILGVFQHGGGDPTFARDESGHWLARRTPAGPGTLLLQPDPAGGDVLASAWGAGASWLLDAVPDLLGAGDDPTGFVPQHPVLAQAQRRFDGWRVPRSRLVLDSLVPAVIEQKVTGKEAFASYRTLVRRFGEPAPGPERGLYVAPTARDWAAIPSWEWLQAGVTPKRSATVIACARVAGRLEQCPDLPLPAARARLQAVPGVGTWTMAEVAQRALGDPDSPSFGDYHLAKNVGWALVSRRDLDDADLAELLEPYAGHRYRAVRLLELAGGGAPRRGPRMTLPTHLPTR